MKLLLPHQYYGPEPTFDAAEFADTPVEVVRYDAQAPVPAEHCDAEVLVVWGQSADMLADAAENLRELRLIQALLAGPDAIVAAGFPDDIPICTGVGLHDGPVTEQTVALALALVRRFPHLARKQKDHEWDSDMAKPQKLRGEDGRVLSMVGARVTIWGFGSIGQNLAPVLTALGAEVTGVATTAGERAGYRTVTAQDFPTLLPDTDILVMILPSVESTTNALDAEVIGMLPRGAYVVNVGRGTTVDEDALVAALTEGRLAGAGLDVFQTEPLPAESPLWEAPNTIITPHCAGGRPIGADALIQENVAALLADRELRNLVER